MLRSCEPGAQLAPGELFLGQLKARVAALWVLAKAHIAVVGLVERQKGQKRQQVTEVLAKNQPIEAAHELLSANEDTNALKCII